MASREQKSYELFKFALQETISKEEGKLEKIININNLIGDKELDLYIGKRQSFLYFCKTCNNNVQNFENYKGNEALLDSYQKDYYLNIDVLKKDALKLMAKNQKIWFEKLYTKNFEQLKTLMRSLLISENRNDLAINERVIAEIELLRYKEGF
jgi:hypothetical protein